MSLQEDAKKLLPIIQAAAEGKPIVRKVDGERCVSLKLQGVLKYDNRFEPLDNLYIVEPSKYRAWKDVAEMGEAVNHWFRIGQCNAIWKILRFTAKTVFTIDHNEIQEYSLPFSTETMHTATPWIEDSWKPCGVDVKQ